MEFLALFRDFAWENNLREHFPLLPSSEVLKMATSLCRRALSDAVSRKKTAKRFVSFRPRS